MTTATMFNPHTAVLSQRDKLDRYQAGGGIQRPVLAVDEPDRCAVCGIFVFDDPAEAAVYQIPYAITVNHAVGELCIGCAGGDESVDRLLFLVERIEGGQPIEPKESRMSENGLFLKMEIGVMPPSAVANRGESKWTPLETEILKIPIAKDGLSEWARFKMESAKVVSNAGTWLAKRAKDVYEPQGHSVRRRTVKNEDGTAWLYVQRYKLKENS